MCPLFVSEWQQHQCPHSRIFDTECNCWPTCNPKWVLQYHPSSVQSEETRHKLLMGHPWNAASVNQFLNLSVHLREHFLCKNMILQTAARRGWVKIQWHTMLNPMHNCRVGSNVFPSMCMQLISMLQPCHHGQCPWQSHLLESSCLSTGTSHGVQPR